MFKNLVILMLIFYVNNGSEAPVIGILSQETEVHDSYIAASYVKYLESSGARVIPVWIGQNKDYYRKLLNYTNGILFPGGGAHFNVPKGYVEAAMHIYQLAIEFNNEGVYYPIWGTCLGMEVLTIAALNGKDIRVKCQPHNKALPLDFMQGYKRSKLFSKAPEDILDYLKLYNVTYNSHSYCLTEEILKQAEILSNWRILSTNKDSRGFEFISAIESVDYPMYGVQFHPEKNRFEFKGSEIPHSKEAVRISQYFANFFVDECRKNKNNFPSEKMQEKLLIYNYNPIYTGPTSKYFEQKYVFNIQIQNENVKNWKLNVTTNKRKKINRGNQRRTRN